MKYIITIICLFQLLHCSQSYAADWQWSVKAKGILSKETNDYAQAFLWIPDNCKQVKAVVVSQQNMCEETLFDHPRFREAMSELDFGIIWIAPGIDYQWDVTNGCQEVFDKMLSDLADISGYHEIRYAPIVPLGHSAMATFPWNFAAWNPKRTLAVVSYKGDAPRTNLTGYGRENLEWGRTRNIDGIPGLMIEGEYEWWEARVNPALAFRMMYPESCISFLCDRGQGHFDVSDKVVDYITLFLRKAAQYRLPENQSLDEPAELIKLDPQKGWLAERWQENRRNRPKAAAYGLYNGDKHVAFWYFDKEMANATENYYKESANKEMRYIGYAIAGKLLDFNKAGHAQYEITPDIKEDLTFHIKAVLTDSLRSKVINSTLSKAEALAISKINGPVEKVNDTTFRVSFYRMGLNNPRRTGDIWLLAHQEEDQHYKSAVQQINIKVPYPLLVGERQYILFPGLQDVPQGTESVTLDAMSDKGLDISYYVKEGPAEIVGNKLIFTQIPLRAKFPLKVTVVAWQYGLKDKIQSAEPVERSFFITQ
jgi:hypothetical protein